MCDARHVKGKLIGMATAARRRKEMPMHSDELDKPQAEHSGQSLDPVILFPGYDMSPMAKLAPEEQEDCEEDERRAAHARALAEAARDYYAYLDECWNSVSEWAIIGKPVESIRELVDSYGDEAQERIKGDFLDRMLESGNADLVAMAQALSEKPASFFAEMSEGAADLYSMDDLIGFLDVFYEDEYEIYKRLARSGYSLEITKDDFTHSLYSCLKQVDPFARVFYHDDMLTVVMMEEYRDLFGEVDWDEQDRRRELVEHALGTAHSMAFFCGVATAEDAYRQYLAWYPDEDLWGSEDAFAGMLRKTSINRDIVDVGFVCHDPDGYEEPTLIVSFDVLSLSCYYDEEVEDEEADEFLDTVIYGLASRHETVGFSGLPDDAKGVDPFEYCLELPQAKRIEAFLYEHVPDEEEYDHVYVEDALDAIVEALVQNPETPDKALKAIMDEEIVSVGSFEEMQEFADCFMQLSGVLPCWFNNGCPPNALHDRLLGKKTFYDELGRPLKVGRNDPCPCGSGKKYKKCCGRNA